MLGWRKLVSSLDIPRQGAGVAGRPVTGAINLVPDWELDRRTHADFDFSFNAHVAPKRSRLQLHSCALHVLPGVRAFLVIVLLSVTS